MKKHQAQYAPNDAQTDETPQENDRDGAEKLTELEQAERKLLEAHRIIRYVLSANIPEAVFTEDEDVSSDAIDQIAKGAFSACEHFLSNGAPVFMGTNPFDPSRESLFHPFEFSSRWGKILRDDAVVKWYIVARDHIILNNESKDSQGKLRMPKALKYAYDWTTPDHRIQGLEYLIGNDEVTITKEGEFRPKEIRRYDDSTKKIINRDNTAFRKGLTAVDCAFGSTYKNHTNIIQEKTSRDNGERANGTPLKHYYVRLGKLEYAAALRSVKSLGHLTQVPTLEEFTKKQYQKYLEACQSIVIALHSDRMKRADLLYTKAKLEEELGFYLGNCLYRNMSDIKSDGSCLFKPDDAKKLSDAFQLPNYFTRTLLVNSAFNDLKAELKRHRACDQYRGGHRSCDEGCPNYKVCAYKRMDNDFFSLLRAESASVYLSKELPTNPLYDSIYGWMELYGQMVYYLANFIFPLYESVFFVGLYRAAQQHVKVTSPNIPREEIPQKVREEIFCRLGNYINTNEIYDATEAYTPKKSFEQSGVSKDVELLRAVNTVMPEFNFERLGYSSETCELYRVCIRYSQQSSLIKAPISDCDLPRLLPQREALMQHLVLEFMGTTGRAH